MPAVPAVDARELARRLLRPAWPYTDVRVVAETGSTNADLAAAVRAGAGPGEILVAEHQTAGRGRFARQWETVAGANIAMSVSWQPKLDATRWGWLPLVAGLGVCDGLRELGADAWLKWPNDVLLAGPAPGKVSGILAELVTTDPAPICVIGVGINVGLAVDELPVPTATSLHLAGCAASKTDVVAAVAERWADWQARLLDGVDLREDYQRRCATVGKRVRVQLDGQLGRGELIEGTATGVDEVGELIISTDAGPRLVPAGDVFHVR